MLPTAACWCKQSIHVMNKRLQLLAIGPAADRHCSDRCNRRLEAGQGRVLHAQWSCHAGCQQLSQQGSTDANGKLRGEEGSQLCDAGHKPLPGVAFLEMEISSFASLLNGHISGELWNWKWHIHVLFCFFITSPLDSVCPTSSYPWWGQGQDILSCPLVAGTLRKYPENVLGERLLCLW